MTKRALITTDKRLAIREEANAALFTCRFHLQGHDADSFLPSYGMIYLGIATSQNSHPVK
jgi:hypothetical protein